MIAQAHKLCAKVGKISDSAKYFHISRLFILSISHLTALLTSAGQSRNVCNNSKLVQYPE